MNPLLAALELENPRTNPITAIESLIADQGAASILLARLAALRTSSPAPHGRLHRIHFRWPFSANSANQQIAVRRIVIALGAMRSTTAVPALLDTLAGAHGDVKLVQAVAWALAIMSEAALLPLLSFARRRNISAPARAVAIVTIGHIPDPRAETILDHLWREYCLEEPCLAIAALVGLTASGLGDSARERAAETERLWQARVSRHPPGTATVFEQAAKLLNGALEELAAAESLPTWPSVLRALASP